jgi:dsRNA-specific ribonuclease
MNISENNKTNFDNKKPKNLKPCLFHHSRVSRQSALAYIHVYDTDNQRIEQK